LYNSLIIRQLKLTAIENRTKSVLISFIAVH
jgi:hypothetical protein